MAENTASYVRGELDIGEEQAFKRHLNACETCLSLVQGFRGVVEKLEQRSVVSPSPDLTDRVLAEIPESAWSDGEGRVVLLPVLSRVAAVIVALLCGVALLVKVLSPAEEGGTLVEHKAEAIHGALKWLASAQDPSGAWNPERWGGKKDYTVSLTSMAVLTFLRDEKGLDDPSHVKAVDRGLAYLLKQQQGDGSFGPRFTGTMYNHGMAAVALLEAQRQGRDPGSEIPLNAALKFIRQQQHTSGGWGYEKTEVSKPNTSISVWQLEALALARAQGWKDVTPSLGGGLAWLKGMVDEQGQFGYQKPKDSSDNTGALTAMGAYCLFKAASESSGAEAGARIRMAFKNVASDPGKEPDFYRSYFIASALKEGKTEEYGSLLAGLQGRLIKGRNTRASNSGSWDPVGRWSGVGGRLYTTTMATLSLEEGVAKPTSL